MTARRVVILRCDGHGRTGSCEHDYAGRSGLTVGEVRAFAELQGWAYSRSARRDYCPEHRPSAVRS